MPHARGEKSSAWNGQAATNQTPNPSQYVLVSFHLISRAIRPLQPTPSGSLFSKIQDKTTPKGRVHFHHDTRPLKTCHRQFFIRTPTPLGSIWQEGSNQKLSMTSDGVVPRWGLVCRGGRVTKRVFNGRVSWWKCKIKLKISTHSTTWQFKTIKLVQRPIPGGGGNSAY